MIGAPITDSISQAANTNKKLSLHCTSLIEGLLIFLGAAIFLFLFTGRAVIVFDEGILLTAAMRTMAGQILHRDFYFNYGPAQLYLLAGLFKMFGASVLVERLTGAALAAGMVTSLYILVRKFCGRFLAFAAAIVSMLWSLGLLFTIGLMSPTLAILALWTSWLILPVSDERVQRRRAMGAGLLTGIMFLFRYDMGGITVVADMIAVVIMMWIAEPRLRKGLKRVGTVVMMPYLSTFVITILPFSIAYLCVASLHDLLDDTFLYGKWAYPVGRGLPFPIPRLGPTFQQIAVYLLPIIIALALWLVIRRAMKRKTTGPESGTEEPDWLNLFVVLGVVAVIFAAKGFVRAGIGGMSVSAIVCVLLLAILLKHRAALNIWLRGVLAATAVLFVLAALVSAQIPLVGRVQSIREIHLQPLAINWILTSDRQPPSPAFRTWCHEGTPITRGFCFLLDEDNIQAVRYLDAHTRPGDYLYSGLDHHDRILMNDMILYFATQRLPAVKWAQLDPMVENLSYRQRDMIHDLELHKPPYIVLDSEFDDMREPNGSSVSTGVHLLDDYISSHYETVQQYGTLAILRRR